MMTCRHRILTWVALSAGLAGAATTATASNLLVDPGFEVNPLVNYGLVLGNFPAYEGDWGVEAATITGAQGGVTPPEGVQMLRMVDDGLVATQAFQVTDVTSYAGLIDSGGATVNLSALFDVDSNVPAASASVVLTFHSAATYGSQIGSPISSGITLDNLPVTWEPAYLSGPVPVGTRWLVSQVAYNNASLGGNPGYVDGARLDVLPEPATLGLLALGGVGVMVRRRR